MAGNKKRPSSKTRPNRNSLCPCGSGRAFKNCCAGSWGSTSDKPESLPNQFKRIAIGAAGVAVLAAGISLAIIRPWEEEPERRPFEYDSRGDRYWSAEHGHWHEGRPTYQPWEYDPETNQYWHPEHAHWHDGRPPPPEERL